MTGDFFNALDKAKNDYENGYIGTFSYISLRHIIQYSLNESIAQRLRPNTDLVFEILPRQASLNDRTIMLQIGASFRETEYVDIGLFFNPFIILIHPTTSQNIIDTLKVRYPTLGPKVFQKIEEYLYGIEATKLRQTY